MKIASMIFGMAMMLGFRIDTTMPSWMELIVIVVVFLCATSLILIPIIVTYLEGKEKKNHEDH